VATDVAARGIDVPEVALVVQTKVVPDFSSLACPARFFVRRCLTN